MNKSRPIDVFINDKWDITYNKYTDIYYKTTEYFKSRDGLNPFVIAKPNICVFINWT